ncbi:hypothetical protein L5515_007641 [Caenorhabditis briggsae]|uniref:G-protein coupled receptors family 1 profile domain-containing protein n=1 Tax=Caenorhabditis briggsae TaxID=6238 RepID=A0AAE9JMH4_CAEBR|nr:hypothetical protein L5515_007641 [Caenorhabditis briggsae]
MMNSGKTHQNSGRKTKLVLYLTITFFIADFPLGIVIFAKLFFNPHSAIVEFMNLFTMLFSFGLTLDTSTHMFICFYMSSQYRNAAKAVFCCSLEVWKRFEFQKKKSEVVSVGPPQIC